MGKERSAIITLTRAQRDVIFEEIEFVFESARDLSFMLEHGAESICDRIYARDLISRLGIASRILDQLSWRPGGDRDSYLLEVDAEVDSFVERIERYALAALEDMRPGLTDADDHIRASARRLIDFDLDALDAARTVRAAFRQIDCATL